MTAATVTETSTLDGVRTPFLRLVRVELRKTVDTRAGLWILVAIAVVTIGAAALALWIVPGESLTFATIADFASSGWSLLLPFLGVLAATSEWSQRTGLTTFALEPRRTLVNVAKLAAALLVGLAMVIITYAAAAIVNILGTGLFDGVGTWAITAGAVLGSLATMAIYVTMGVGLGLLLLNTPLAIVTFIVAPIALSALILVPALTDVIPWLDVSSASLPLIDGSLTGGEWARLGTATALWCAVPLGVGLWRTSRREVA